MANPITVTINLRDSSPKLSNFGLAALLCKAPFAVQSRTYNCDDDGLTAMVTDGFTTKSQAHKVLSAMKAQDNGAKQLKVFNRTAQNAQAYDMTPIDTTPGAKYTFGIEGPTGTKIAIDYTVLAAATATTISTALVALITGIGVTATAGSGKFTLAPTVPGDRFWLSGIIPQQMTVKDTSPDAGIATDLAAALVEDSDFFGVLIDSTSELENDAAAAWAISNRRVFIGSTVDSIVGTSSTTDVGSDVYALAGNFAKIMYEGDDSFRASAALMSSWFGSGPAAGLEFRKLPGCTAPKIAAGFIGYLDTKLVGYMVLDMGETIVRNTKFPNRYPDLVRGFEWFKERLRAAVLKAQIDNSNPGISFTLDGIGILVSAIAAECTTAVNEKLLAPGFQVVPTPLDEVSPLDKSARYYKVIRVIGTLQGKIEKLDIIVDVAP